MSRNKIDPEHDLDITKPDHNIIAIPTRLNKRAVMNGKAKDQKAVAALSLGSVLLIGLLLNQLISKNNSSNIALVHEGRRQVASVNQGVTPEGIKWESELAAQLNSSDIQVVGAKKPLQNDQLLFGELQGQYSAKLDNALKIRYLELVGEGNLDVKDVTTFLLTKKHLWSREFDQALVVKDDGSNIEVELLLKKNKIGKAKLERNAFGFLKSLDIQ